MADDYEDDFDYLDDFEDAGAAGGMPSPSHGSPAGMPPQGAGRTAAQRTLARQRSALVVTSLDALYDKLRDGKVKYGAVQAPEQRVEAASQCDAVARIDAVVQAPDDLGAPSRSMSSLLAEMGSSKSSSEALRKELLARLNHRAARFFRAATTVVERLLEQNVVALDKVQLRRDAPAARTVGSGAPVFAGPAVALLGGAAPAASSYAAALKAGSASPGSDDASPLAAALKTPLLRDRKVLCTAASPLRPEVMAIALGPAPPRMPGAPQPPSPDGAVLEPRFRAASLVAIVDTGLCATAAKAGGAARPPVALLHVLLCWGRPTSLCFDAPPAASNFGARGTAAFVFAGTSEGTLHMWCLEEPAWMHPQVYGSVPAEGSSAAAAARQPLRLPTGLRAPSYSTSVAAAPPATGEDATEAVPAAPVRSVTPITRYPVATLFNTHEKQVLAREISAAVSAVDGASPRKRAAAQAAAAPIEDPDAAKNDLSARNRFLRGLPPMGAGLGSVLNAGGGAGGRRLGGAAGAGSSLAAPGGGLGGAAAGAADASSSSASSLSVQVLAVDENGCASIWTPVVVSRAGGAGAGRLRQAEGETAAAGSSGAGSAAGSASGAGSSFAGGGVLVNCHRDAGGRLSLGLLDLIDTRDLGRSTASRMKMVCVARLGAEARKKESVRGGGGSGGEGGADAAAPAAGSAGARLGRLALANSLADGAVPGDGTACDVCPADPTKYAIGVSGQAGRIHLRNRSGEDAATSATTRTVLLPYNPCEAKSGAGAVAAAGASALPPTVPNASATTLAFHPVFSSYLLAGFADGTVALYSVEHAVPLSGWTAPWMPPGGSGEPTQPLVSPVLRVAWLPSRPSCFMAADARGWVGVWDLETTPARPVAVVNLGAALPAEVAAAGGAAMVGFDILGGTDLAPASVSLVGTFATGHVVSAALHPSFAVATDADPQRRVRKALEGIGQ